MKKTAIYLVLTLLVLTGCKKYEEGPAISLRSKEARLCREWKVEKLQLNGSEVAETEDWGIIEFIKGGDVKVTINDQEFGEIVYEAQWRFANDKEFLEVSEYDYHDKTPNKNIPAYLKNIFESEWTSYEILRLTSSELFLKYSFGQDYEYRFEYKAN
jgi:hypothetical protein